MQFKKSLQKPLGPNETLVSGGRKGKYKLFVLISHKEKENWNCSCAFQKFSLCHRNASTVRTSKNPEPVWWQDITKAGKERLKQNESTSMNLPLDHWAVGNLEKMKNCRENLLASSQHLSLSEWLETRDRWEQLRNWRGRTINTGGNTTGDTQAKLVTKIEKAKRIQQRKEETEE